MGITDGSCRALLSRRDGEYEGWCILDRGHDSDHWDGVTRYPGEDAVRRPDKWGPED